MNILHICSITNNRTSGVSNVVPEHFIHQKKYSNVAILNCNSTKIDKLNDIDNVYYYSDYKKICNLPFTVDIAIFHSFYIPIFIKLSKELLHMNIPYIIVPHGSLTFDAQKQKKLKKTIANYLFFNRFIKNSNAIQYLSESEKKMSSLINKKSFIIGNGINLTNNVKKTFSKNGLKLVYIGRYSIYTKGIDLIVKVVEYNCDYFINNNVTIDLYGSGADGVGAVQKLLNEKTSKIIKINGPVFDKEKENVLLNHDVFIQLSRHEGQPLGIMEAMSYGLPVIVSDGTSFGNIVNQNECGYVGNSSSEIFEGINKCFENKKKLDVLSKNSNIYAKKNFSWDMIAKNEVEKYYQIIKECGDKKCI